MLDQPIENKPFKTAAMTYKDVVALLQLASPEKPVTMRDIFNALPQAKSEQQIRDALKSIREKGNLASMPINGTRAKAYWWKEGGVYVPVPRKKPALDKENPAINTTMYEALVGSPVSLPLVDNRPDIRITDNTVVITSNKVKITLEF